MNKLCSTVYHFVATVNLNVLFGIIILPLISYSVYWSGIDGSDQGAGMFESHGK